MPDTVSDFQGCCCKLYRNLVAVGRKPKRVSDVNAMGYTQGGFGVQSPYANGAEVPVVPAAAAAAAPYGGGRFLQEEVFVIK